MRRAATVVFLSGWLGFLVVSAFTACFAVATLAGIEMPRVPWLADEIRQTGEALLLGGNGVILAAMVAAILSLMTASAFALAIWLLQRNDPEERRSGERLAFAGLATVGVMVASFRFGGTEAFPEVESLAVFGTILGMSMLAVLFDRLIEIEETSSDDDDDLRAAAMLIGQGMAREATLRTVVRDGGKQDRIG